MSAIAVLTEEQLADLLERAVKKASAATIPSVDSAPPEVLTRKQAADLLQVDPHAIPSLVSDEGLPYAKLGREWRFLRSEVLAWMSARTLRKTKGAA